MNERGKWKSQLADRELLAADLEAQLRGLVALVRDHLDPHQPVADISFDVAAGLLVGGEAVWRDYRQVLVDIRRLKRSLEE